MRVLLDTHAVVWWLANDARLSASEAASFYTERFRKAFREASEVVGSAGDQLNDWLRRSGDDDAA